MLCLKRYAHSLAGLRANITSRPCLSWFARSTLYNTASKALQRTVPVDFGGKDQAQYHPIWLRDHCCCSECHHPLTKQRLINTSLIPQGIFPLEVKDTPMAVKIKWPDGHISEFDKSWLKKHAYWPVLRAATLEQPKEKHLWDAEISSDPPAVDYEKIMQSEQGLSQWLENIDVYGVSLVYNVPKTIKDTKELAERIAFIRPTHYGEFWDMKPNLEHGDTAYTSIALDAHTDTTYFSDPIGLEMFHLLEFDGIGGESLLVDGFNVAKQLQEISPNAYKILTKIPLAAHCAGDPSTYIYPTPRYHPLLNLDERTGELYQIRYNNNDRSVLNHLQPEEVQDFYDALREWQSLVTSKKNEVWFPLKPGTCLIFDNWRVMHGRAAFTGHRRLTGCYINGDDWRSRLRTVNKHPKDMF